MDRARVSGTLSRVLTPVTSARMTLVAWRFMAAADMTAGPPITDVLTGAVPPAPALVCIVVCPLAPYAKVNSYCSNTSGMGESLAGVE
jgi:hypothetical protein